jgi:hypothetical protein
MYYLYRFHNITPENYYNMKIGNRIILNSFVEYEIEQKAKENGGDE